MGSMPFFPFYPKDWLGSVSVQAMTRSERSVYMDLLACMWDQAPKRGKPCLPADDKFICRLLRATAEEWADWRYALIDGPSPVFSVDDDGMLVNARLLEEWGKATKLSETRSNAGRAGAAGRWGDRGADDMANASQTHGDGNADAMASDKQGNGKSMPSHMSHPTEHKTQGTGKTPTPPSGGVEPAADAGGAPAVEVVMPAEEPPTPQQLAKAAYDLLKDSGHRPSSSGWVGKAITRIRDGLTPEARGQVLDALRLAIEPGEWRYTAGHVSACDFGPLIDRYKGGRPRASPSDDSAAIDRFLAIGGDE